MSQTHGVGTGSLSIVDDPDVERRMLRLRAATHAIGVQEFVKRREGMVHAMNGGLWLHRHVWMGRAMVHMVSTNRERLLEYGRALGLPDARLQFKRLKDPRTSKRRDAWHWDLGGPVLPPADERLFGNSLLHVSGAD